MAKVKAKSKRKKKRTGRPPKPISSSTIRIGVDKISDLHDMKAPGMTFDDLMEELIMSRNLIDKAEKMYLVDDELIAGIDLKEARGIAITNAVKQNRVPEMPKILLMLGDDDGI